MIAIIDGKQYYIDEDKIIQYVKEKVEAGLDRKIQIPNGPTVDLRSKGLLATALRTVASFTIPVIQWAADKIGCELPARRRHEDAILYVLNAYFLILKASFNDVQLDFITVPYVEDIRQVVDFTANKEDTSFPLLLGASNGEDSIS